MRGGACACAQIHVVEEQRLYCEWGEGAEGEGEGEGRVGAGTGLLAARRALNELHAELARDNYSQVYY